MTHFFAPSENFRKDKVIIEGSDVNHIRNVLRMKEGDELIISDGEGQQALCTISDISEDSVICDILSVDVEGTEPSVKFYLFQGLPKSDKFELIIQKSVELGVYEIIPTITARSIVKYDEKKKKNKLERWQKIAEGAAKQSGRGIIPEVHDFMSFKQALEYAKSLDMMLIPYENFKGMAETKAVLSEIRDGMRVGIFIGPEGGFENSEVQAAAESGAEKISLGARILRTETAPLMLLSVLMFQMEK